MNSLQIVGGGRMGEALLAGLLRAGADPGVVTVVEPDAARCVELADRYGVATSPSVISSRDAVLAVKPHLTVDIAAQLSQAGVERVLSIAAGVTLASIEAAAGGSVAVIRAMPNTPALVGRGAAGLAGGSHADDNDIEWARQLLAGVGVAVVVAESALDAVTGLSGSGPAYVFLFAEAMIEAGVLNGLPRPLAETLAINTIVGAGEMLLGGRDPAQLRADVTSPGGTTAEGLRALEDHGVRAAVLDAVSRATAKSRDLGAEW